MPDGAYEAARRVFEDEGLEPHTWSNSPGFVYGEHTHGYHKVLVCASGSILFRTPEGEIGLVAGQRLDLPAGTPHSAVVGPAGVTCLEAARS